MALPLSAATPWTAFVRRSTARVRQLMATNEMRSYSQWFRSLVDARGDRTRVFPTAAYTPTWNLRLPETTTRQSIQEFEPFPANPRPCAVIKTTVARRDFEGPSAGVPMAEPLRTADLDDRGKPAPRGAVRSMPRPAADSLDFTRPVKEFSVQGGHLPHSTGAQRGALPSRLRHFYSIARRQTADSCDQLARRCQNVAWRTVQRLRRTRQARPLLLLGMIAGVTFAAGIAIRLWGLSHE